MATDSLPVSRFARPPHGVRKERAEKAARVIFGLMATAGQLVFGSSLEGRFFALDEETGEALWHFNTGGHIRTNPMGFAVDGRQRVAITGGNTLFVFGLK